MKSKEQLNELSRLILDACITVHREKGPGLLEGVYQHCLVERISYKGYFSGYHGSGSFSLQGFFLDQGLRHRYAG
ncbi:MAG TPA: GxxExxY protein [Ohtaekwangia sp.]